MPSFREMTAPLYPSLGQVVRLSWGDTGPDSFCFALTPVAWKRLKTERFCLETFATYEYQATRTPQGEAHKQDDGLGQLFHNVLLQVYGLQEGGHIVHSLLGHLNSPHAPDWRNPDTATTFAAQVQQSLAQEQPEQAGHELAFVAQSIHTARALNRINAAQGARARLTFMEGIINNPRNADHKSALLDAWNPDIVPEPLKDVLAAVNQYRQEQNRKQSPERGGGR